MAKGIKRRLKAAERNAARAIDITARDGGKYARGLSSEGYLGGYRDALSDVMLLMNGVEPPSRGRRIWKEEPNAD